jgi:tRNA nucleotidyltransferase (CCA-adding enzyme)
MNLITSHVGADFDALASMVAAQLLYPDSVAAFAGSVDRNVREFVSLFEEELDVRRPSEVAVEQVTNLVMVDTQNPRRLGAFARLFENPNVVVHVYDHHPAGGWRLGIGGQENEMVSNPQLPTPNPRFQVVTAEVGATITLLLRLLRERGITPTPTQATLFALGIYEETGGLIFSHTTVEDVRAVADLMEWGADLDIVASYLSRSFTERQRKLLNELILNTEYHKVQGVLVAIAQATADEYVDEIALLAHRLCDIENVGAVFGLIQTSGAVFMVGRSKVDAIDVGQVLERLGGGGHHRAASALMKATRLDKVRRQLLGVLNEEIKPQATAQDIMSSPVRTIRPDTTVEEASRVMLRYGHGGLTVVDGGKVVGVVTRKDIDKARHHNLHAAPVKALMTTDVPTASPQTSALELEELLVTSAVGRVPIVVGEQIVGIVTRADILRARYGRQVPISRKPVERIALDSENVADLMKQRLPEWTFDLLVQVGVLGARLKMPCFVVGGFVRDLLLGEPNFDVDVLIEGDGIALAQELGRELDAKKITPHHRFGTAVIVLPVDLKIDVATARTEFYEYPAALPQVEYATVKEDMFRRDFTINAMAVQLNPENFGKLLDFFGGRVDLQSGVVRVLHNLSFIEDPTRILRAVRFEQRYGFRMDRHTEALIAEAVGQETFTRLTEDRMREELILLLEEPDPIPALHRLSHLDVLKHVHERLAFDEEVYATLERIREAITWFVKTQNSKLKTQNWLVYLMPLLRDMSLTEARQFCRRLKIEGESQDVLIEAKETAESLAQSLSETVSKYDLRQMLLKSNSEVLLFVMAKANEATVTQRVQQFFTELRDARADVTGEDLMRLGWESGPTFRRALAAALQAKLDEGAGREEQLQAALAALSVV